jgi:hypothetical protein
MWILGTYGSAALVVMMILGLALRSVNQFVEESDKQHIKRKIENFWLSTAELNTSESVGKALKSHYRQMKRNIPFFAPLLAVFATDVCNCL